MFDYNTFFFLPFKPSIKEILCHLFSSGVGSVPSPELLEQEAPEFALTLTAGEAVKLRGFPLRTFQANQLKAGQVDAGISQSLNDMFWHRSCDRSPGRRQTRP